MLRTDVERAFNGTILAYLHEKPSIKNFVLNHERKNLCIDNIMEQIKIIHKRRLRMNRETMLRLIADVAKNFAYAALTEKEQQLMSKIQKRELTAKEDRIKDIESTFVKDNEKEALATAHKVYVPGNQGEAND